MTFSKRASSQFLEPGLPGHHYGDPTRRGQLEDRPYSRARDIKLSDRLRQIDGSNIADKREPWRSRKSSGASESLHLCYLRCVLPKRGGKPGSDPWSLSKDNPDVTRERDVMVAYVLTSRSPPAVCGSRKLRLAAE